MTIERSAMERLEGEHAPGAAQAGWHEDVRVDPERRRESLVGGVHAHGAFEAAPPEHTGHALPLERAPYAGRGTPPADAERHEGYTYVDRRAVHEPADARELAARTSSLHATGDEARALAAREHAAQAAPAGEARREPEGLVRTLVRGAVAGAIGALALSLTHRASSRVLLGDAGAAPNPPARAAEQMGERAGVALTERQADAAGTALVVGYGALLGAVYGLVQERVHAPALANALALGGLSYAATATERGLLPRLGLVSPPTEQALLAAMVPVDAHLAYGVTTAAAYEALS